MHASAWTNLPETKLVGVYGSSPERRESFARDFGIPHVATLEELISRCDVVDVVTQNHLHFTQGQQAIRAGRHVLIEKPTALTHKEALELACAADRAKVKHGTVHPMRFSPSFNAFWEHVEAGTVGVPVRCEVKGCWPRPASYYAASGGWRSEPGKSGGGVLIHQFIHLLDLALWRLGDIVRIESCTMKRPNGKGVEQSFTAEAQFASGVTVNLDGSSGEGSPGAKSFVVHGGKGRIAYGGGKIAVRLDGDGTERIIPYPPEGNPLESLLLEFAQSIETGCAFSPSLFDGAANMKVIEALYSLGRK
jgi:predicted dehydrogenase